MGECQAKAAYVAICCHMLPYFAIQPSWMLYELMYRRHKLIVWVETSELGQVFRLAGSVFVGEFRWSWQIKEGPQWPHQHADGVRNCDNTFWQWHLETDNYDNCNFSVGKSAVNGCNSFSIARLLMTINVYCQDGDMLAVVPLVLVIIFPWLTILSHDSSPPKDRRVICPLQHTQYRNLLLIFLFFFSLSLQ